MLTLGHFDIAPPSECIRKDEYIKAREHFYPKPSDPKLGDKALDRVVAEKQQKKGKQRN